MQTISNILLIREARETWPGMSFVWVPDQSFIRPRMDDVLSLATQSGVKEIPMRGEAFDCDDYALQLHAFIKRNAPELWAFGEATGSRFKNIHEPHTLNICWAEDGIYIIEPQTYAVWIADPKHDRVMAIKL